MKLLLDVSRFSFTVTRGVQEKTDQDGRQKMESRTKEPLWTVQVMALPLDDDADGEMLLVTLAGMPPKLTKGQAVVPVELEAIPWNHNGRNGVAFRAKALNPATADRKAA